MRMMATVAVILVAIATGTAKDQEAVFAGVIGEYAWVKEDENTLRIWRASPPQYDLAIKHFTLMPTKSEAK